LLLLVFHSILAKLCLSPSLRQLVFFLFVTAPFLYTHVFSGLETITFTALLLSSSLQLHSLITSRSASFLPHAALASSLFVLSLCRPEGVAYAAIVCCILICTAALHVTSRRTFILSFVFFLVFPGTLYFIWRWQYYGYPFPNSFYAKQALSLSGTSIYELAHFFIQYLLLPTMAVITCLILSPNEAWKHFHQKYFQLQKRADILMLGSLVLFGLVIVSHYLQSNLFMNFSYRFYVPLYPIGLFFLVWFLSPLLGTGRLHLNTIQWQHRLILFGLGMIYLTQIVFHTKWLLKREIPFALEYETRLSEMHRAAGPYLKQRVPESEWLVVHFDAGAIPYYSGLRTVDFGGLNDEYLAHNKSASIKDRLNYFFSKRPGAVVFTSYEWERVNHGYEASAIVSDPRFKIYKLVRKFGNSTSKKYYEFVFIRNDLLTKPGSQL